MFGIHVTDDVEIQVKHIEQMLTDNPDTRKSLQDAIRQLVWMARNSVSHNMAGIFQNGDPMEARRSVRNSVYRSILGGKLTIASKRKGEGRWRVVQKDRIVEQNPKMRGGNRRRRSMRTIKMQGYEPTDRGMILNWVNAGTKDRYASGRNGKTMIQYLRHIYKTNGRGFRGNIMARDFFEPMANAAFTAIAPQIKSMIEAELEKSFNKNT